MMASLVRRPSRPRCESHRKPAPIAIGSTPLASDSDYDYDPVWAQCVKLGVAPTFHSVGYGWGSRATPSSYIHNHLGNFASSADAICRGLVMGGVPERFPQIEIRLHGRRGGLGALALLRSDFALGKRNRTALENYNPALVNHNDAGAAASAACSHPLPSRK